MSIRLKVTSQIAVFSADILLAGMKLLGMDYLPIPSTFDEIIPPVYNQIRLYIGGITMCAPKRILSLSRQDYKILLRCILEYRNELIQKKECATIYDDLIIKLLRKEK